MNLSSAIKATAALLLIFAGRGSPAQEPAFLYGTNVVRFQEGPDFFHYVIPCKQAVAGTPGNELTAASTKMQPALCWPVRAVRLEMVNGKFERRELADGSFAVSASLVRFLPNDPKQLNLVREMIPQQALYQHPHGSLSAVVATKDAAYNFVFKNICSQCVSGTPEPQTKDLAQLDTEFSTFGDSLRNFDAVSKRMNDIAAQWRVGVTPKNQPTLSDPPEAMGLYSDLNRRFAELCQEPGKSCVQSYATYQACKSGEPARNCGEPPGCSAFCAVNSTTFSDMKAGFCKSKVQDYASVVPDWTEAAKKMDVERTARGPVDPKTLHITAGPPTGPPLDFMGKPIEPGLPCTVESAYSSAMMSHMGTVALAGAGASGSAPPDRKPVLIAGGPNPQIIQGMDGAAGSKIFVDAEVIARHRISGDTPQYPAVAKAAHIQGTVVLKATISKGGEIQNLHVVSGPPMLQQAALDAVKTWRYQPYLLNSQPVEVETLVNVIFVLGVGAGQQQPSAPPSQP